MFVELLLSLSLPRLNILLSLLRIKLGKKIELRCEIHLSNDSLTTTTEGVKSGHFIT